MLVEQIMLLCKYGSSGQPRDWKIGTTDVLARLTYLFIDPADAKLMTLRRHNPPTITLNCFPNLVGDCGILILLFPLDSIVPLAQVQSPSLSPPTGPLLASCRCCLLRKIEREGERKRAQLLRFQCCKLHQHTNILPYLSAMRPKSLFICHASSLI